MKFKIENLKSSVKIVILEIVDEEGIRIEYANKIDPLELSVEDLFPIIKPEILIIKMCGDPLALAATVAHYSRFTQCLAVTDAFFKKAMIIHSINPNYKRGAYLPLALWGSGIPRFVRKNETAWVL